MLPDQPASGWKNRGSMNSNSFGIEAAAQLHVVQRHPGLLPLGVHHRPLPQRQRIVGEHQRQRAVARRGGANQRHLELARQALHAGHRHVAAQRDVVGQQDAQRGLDDIGKLLVWFSDLS